MKTTPLRFANVPTCLLLILASFFAACSGNAAGPRVGDLIDRDVFIATYVDLRVVGLATEDQQITDAGRTEVLSRHGVSESDLLDFAAYHALDDLTFMRQVWDEIEVLLEAQRPIMDDRGRE